MTNYTDGYCAICKMSMNIAQDDWIFINVKLKDLYVPVRVCGAHSIKLLNTAAAKAEADYREIY